MEKKKNIFTYVVAAVAATGGLLFGYDTGVISGALLFLKKEWMLSDLSQEFVVSAVLVGAILGAAFSGKIADYIGRKKVIIIAAVIFALGSVVAAMSQTANQLIASRIVIGIAIGMASCIVPLYISEVSPAKIRGALVSLNQLAITIGIVLSYFVDDTFATLGYSWRYMFLVGFIPAVILFIGMLFLPRTPRWLMSKGHEDEARAVLNKFNDDSSEIEKGIGDIKQSIEEESGASIRDLFLPWMRPALMIGIILMFIQQVTGINTVIYYAPTIFQMAGFQSNVVAITATVGVGIVNVLMTVVAIWLVDKWGRKPLLSIGLAGIVVSLGVLGFAFMEKAALGAGLKWVAVGSLILYIASFAVSLGPICWLIIAEIYPLRIRGLAMSVATVANWAFNFIVALTFLTLVNKLTPTGAFWLYAVVGIGGWFFCKFYVPETKGHSLEEIEDHFAKGKPARGLK